MRRPFRVPVRVLSHIKTSIYSLKHYRDYGDQFFTVSLSKPYICSSVYEPTLKVTIGLFLPVLTLRAVLHPGPDAIKYRVLRVQYTRELYP